MSSIFNRITLLVIIAFIVVFAVSVNEIGKFIDQSRTNGTARYTQWLNTQQTRFNSQEACQTTTDHVCELKQCEYKPAEDGSITEVCGSSFRARWSPTTIAIPAPYQEATSLALTVTTPTLTHHLTLDVPQADLTYTLQTATTSEPVVQTKKIPGEEILRALNTVLLYDLSAGIDVYPQPAGETSYLVTIQGSAAGGTAETKTLGCSLSTCPRTFRPVLRTMIGLWDATLIKTLLPGDASELL